MDVFEKFETLKMSMKNAESMLDEIKNVQNNIEDIDRYLHALGRKSVGDQTTDKFRIMLSLETNQGKTILSLDDNLYKGLEVGLMESLVLNKRKLEKLTNIFQQMVSNN